MLTKVEVEKRAVEFVMNYELEQGRNPKDVSKDKNHIGYDIISDNLKIEVKGRSKDKRPFFLLNQNNILGLENSNDENYRLYVVMNPEENPRLIIFTKQEILDKKIPRRQWEVPLRKEDYDRAISLTPKKPYKQ